MNDIHPELLKVLYNLPPDFDVQVKNAEEKSGVKREHFVYGLLAFLAIYMIIGSEAGLLCNIICFTYPAIVSIQEKTLFPFSVMEKKLTDKAFTFSDFYAERIMEFVPFYWIIKCIYCIYLYLPQTEGINIVEEKIILPALQKFAKKLKREVP
ncbi:Uncharacterized protein BM_BM1444 [Brugia malayi]|uniref:Receptor expression-enhancing protein n=2 Tax=Brugia malayi TaxID=6279 RepID=A0A4E9G089_BRUMA|nr:Uncharacterized protein BM_BM1444 [Brugia malayi]VIO98726.1 Uncharacterized protein BM_BM1444 [Brugia malayi]